MITLFFTILRLVFSSRQTRLLVLFQNNYELRGSGGFLTQLLDVAVGRLRFSPAFRHDYQELKPKEFIQSPPDVQKYLRLKQWYLRDSNVFGDFQKSAHQVAVAYNSLYPKNDVSGVMAVNFHLLERIIGVLGPVRVGAKTFNDKNIFVELSSNVSDIDHHNLEDLNGRKKILQSLFHKVVKTAFMKFWKWPRLYVMMNEAVRTKDFQLCFTDAKRQGMYLRKRLAHDYSNSRVKDFLKIEENNYLGLKSNRYIRRTVFHDVSFDLDRDGKKLSDALVWVKIEWKHCGHYNYPLSGTYQSVAKIHLPLAARDVKVGYAAEKPEFEKTADANVVSLHQILGIQQSSTLEFSYRLPAELFDDGKYSFRFVKQSGVIQEHLHSTVRFPDQYSAHHVDARHLQHGRKKNSSSVREADNVLFFDYSPIDRDGEYICEAVLHHQPSRIFYHEMVGPDTFEIRFNEPVFPDGDKFAVKVMNEKESHLFPNEKVEFLLDNRHLLIHSHGVPKDEEKFYRISLSGIVNSVGVPLGERKVTAVYRSKYFSR